MARVGLQRHKNNNNCLLGVAIVIAGLARRRKIPRYASEGD